MDPLAERVHRRRLRDLERGVPPDRRRRLRGPTTLDRRRRWPSTGSHAASDLGRDRRRPPRALRRRTPRGLGGLPHRATRPAAPHGSVPAAPSRSPGVLDLTRAAADPGSALPVIAFMGGTPGRAARATTPSPTPPCSSRRPARCWAVHAADDQVVAARAEPRRTSPAPVPPAATAEAVDRAGRPLHPDRPRQRRRRVPDDPRQLVDPRWRRRAGSPGATSPASRLRLGATVNAPSGRRCPRPCARSRAAEHLAFIRSVTALEGGSASFLQTPAWAAVKPEWKARVDRLVPRRRRARRRRAGALPPAAPGQALPRLPARGTAHRLGRPRTCAPGSTRWPPTCSSQGAFGIRIGPAGGHPPVERRPGQGGHRRRVGAPR